MVLHIVCVGCLKLRTCVCSGYLESNYNATLHEVGDVHGGYQDNGSVEMSDKDKK